MSHIHIKHSVTGHSQVIFRAPEDPYVARTLWVYLVENLKPGWLVGLHDPSGMLARHSGDRVPPKIYAAVMNLPTETATPPPAND